MWQLCPSTVLAKPVTLIIYYQHGKLGRTFSGINPALVWLLGGGIVCTTAPASAFIFCSMTFGAPKTTFRVRWHIGRNYHGTGPGFFGMLQYDPHHLH